MVVRTRRHDEITVKGRGEGNESLVNDCCTAEGKGPNTVYVTSSTCLGVPCYDLVSLIIVSNVVGGSKWVYGSSVNLGE